LTNLVEFVEQSLSGEVKLDAGLGQAIFQNVNQIADVTLRYHSDRSNKNAEKITMGRRKLATFARSFVRASEPLLEPRVLGALEDSIRDLEQVSPENLILLVSAHQPNLFPFSGVMRKIVLLSFLSRLIETRIKFRGPSKDVKVVCFFGIADHDFVHNKWVRSAEMPAPLRKEGSLRFSLKIHDKADMFLPSARFPPPSDSTLKAWSSQVESWISENSRVADKTLAGARAKGYLSDLAFRNFREFWRTVEIAASTSVSLAQFSSSILFAVSNSLLSEKPVVFANFSECFTALGDEYRWLVENIDPYTEAVERSEAALKEAGVDSGLSEDLSEVIPLWLKCDCGSKYRLTREDKEDRLNGRCMRCQTEVSYSLTELLSMIQSQPERFQPKSISMPIALTRAIDMSCYIGGVGSLGYLIHSKKASDALGSAFPPTPFWFVSDKFTGLEQLAAKTEVGRISKNYGVHGKTSDDLLRVISARIQSGEIARTPVSERDLQILEHISRLSKLQPCMIDYAINIGLRSLGDQWAKFLETNGTMNTDTELVSVFD
jgi:hypothetical protein